MFASYQTPLHFWLVANQATSWGKTFASMVALLRLSDFANDLIVKPSSKLKVVLNTFIIQAHNGQRAARVNKRARPFTSCRCYDFSVKKRHKNAYIGIITLLWQATCSVFYCKVQFFNA